MNWVDLIMPVLIAAVYLIPALIADCRNHRHSRYIALLNIFLGWTVVGWLIALVWACQDDASDVGGIGGG